MPGENTFDVRIAHSSPLFTATPLTGNRTTGWSILCAASGYPCDGIDESAVYTTLAGAKISLQFWGSRIEVRGNVTNGMSLTWEIDGSARTPDANGAVTESANAVGQPLGQGLLGVFSGLDSSKMHTLLMMTKADLPSAVMAFEGAVVTVGTRVAGGTTTLQYLDDTDPKFQYTQTPGGWAQYPHYDSPAFNITLPPGVTNKTFHCAEVPGESASLNFKGTQVLLYGPCYASNGAYTITLNNQDPVVYNASINAYSAPRVESVAQACLRYMSPPLDPDKLHYVSIANADQGRQTNLDWALVVESSGGGYLQGGSKAKSNVGAIAGAVVGTVALLLALAALWFVIRRRRQRVKRVVAHTASDEDSYDRKITNLDLLSTPIDTPILLSDEQKARTLTNPSHASSGSQSNMTSFRRIEPFELPPLVDGARNTGGKAGSAGLSPHSASSGGMQAQLEAAIANGHPTTVESAGIAVVDVPAREEAREHQDVLPPAPTQPSSSAPVPSVPSDAPQSASVPAESSHARAISQPDSQTSAVPDLSQISSDVNRILVQLGQIRRRTDSNANGAQRDTEGMSDLDEDDMPVEAPPQYGKHRRV
ncbi:hypothetical protein BDV93DRAFT_525112 [Ceratobasidium sp. AG-I]|nr:hypothetical protein BDV93DRAFT_525112 [Ceratobasidium sp. AG-I]